LTVQVVDPVVVQVFDPRVDVTVYPVIVDPPSLVGALQLTTAILLPGVAVTPFGAPGFLTDAIAADALGTGAVATIPTVSPPMASKARNALRVEMDQPLISASQ
jgi:hypothetical protein